MAISIPAAPAGGGVPVSGEDATLRSYVDKAHGWANYADGTYTSGSPLALTASTRVKLENDGTGGTTYTAQLPAGSSGLWDTTNDLVTPDDLDDSYDLRVVFNINPDSINGVLFIQLDIGSDPLGASSIVIADYEQVLAKGAVEQGIIVTFPIFCRSTFLANGGTITLECDKDADVYDISVFLVKTNSGDAAPTPS